MIKKILNGVKKPWSIAVITVIAVGLPLLYAFTPKPGSDLFQITKNLSIFSSVYKEIDLYYVEEVEPGKFMKTGIDAMLKSLDPYTNYIPESKIEDYRLMTTGEYGGIGSLIRRDGDYVIISEPYEGYPAQKAGLQAGDKIVEVDGNDVKGKTTQEISTLLKGQSGTALEMTYDRAGERKTISLIREKVKLADVPFSGIIDEENKVGYVKLTSFTNTASQNVSKAIMDMQSEGMKKLIFDLRGNGGGLLHEAVNIVNFFVPKNTPVVETKGRVEDVNRSYKTMNQPIDTELPVVVLIDGSSASASEIVAGSLQDLDRGVIVGMNSFGKGLVQQTKNLEYNAKVKLTIAKYYTPSGRCIQKLDYSAADDDGSGTTVADSLITIYKTKNGRDVNDGRGIDPDVEIDPGIYSRLTATLVANNLIFDYATKFRREHDSIGSARQFVVNDEIYSDFTEFLKGKEYSYTTASEEFLKKLEMVVKEEKYFGDSEEEINALAAKLQSDKEEDLERYKGEIIELLENEIVSRYHYQNGRVEVSINRDPYIASALEVLKDDSRYKGILDGSVKE